MKLKFNKTQFLTYFINSLNSITNECSLFVYPDRVVGVAVGENSTPMLYCKIDQENDIGDNEFVKLNFKNLKKLHLAIKNIPEDDFELNINKNFTLLTYKHVKYSFRIIISLDLIMQKCPINEKKINELEYDNELKLDVVSLKDLNKLGMFSTDSNKIYFYVKDSNLIAELTDKTLTDVDSASIMIQENVTCDKFEEMPFDYSIIKNICKYPVETVTLKINSKFKILNFNIERDGCLISYLITAFIK